MVQYRTLFALEISFMKQRNYFMFLVFVLLLYFHFVASNMPLFNFQVIFEFPNWPFDYLQAIIFHFFELIPDLTSLMLHLFTIIVHFSALIHHLYAINLHFLGSIIYYFAQILYLMSLMIHFLSTILHLII